MNCSTPCVNYSSVIPSISYTIIYICRQETIKTSMLSIKVFYSLRNSINNKAVCVCVHNKLKRG